MISISISEDEQFCKGDVLIKVGNSNKWLKCPKAKAFSERPFK